MIFIGSFKEKIANFKNKVGENLKKKSHPSEVDSIESEDPKNLKEALLTDKKTNSNNPNISSNKRLDKEDILRNLSLKNMLPDPRDEDYNIKSFTIDPQELHGYIREEPFSELMKEKINENRYYLLFFGIFISLFFFFLVSISSLEGYGIPLVLTLYAFDTVLLLKSVVIYFKRADLYKEGTMNYLFILEQFTPVIFIIILFSGLIYIDINHTLLGTLDYAMQHSYLIAFPFLLIATISFSLFHILMEYYAFTIQDLIEKIKIDIFSNPQKLNRHRAIQHFSYSILTIFISLLISAILKMDLLFQISIIIVSSLVINIIYHFSFEKIIAFKFDNRKQKIYERQKDFEELNLFERLKERKKKDISLTECIQREDMIIIGLILAGVFIYAFNIFNLQIFLSHIVITIVQNILILFFGIMVLILFVIIPVSTGLIIVVIKITDYLYEKKAKGVLHIILLYLTSIMFIQIFIFNLQFIEIDTIYQSLIAYIGPALLIISKKVTKKGIKKVIK